MGENFPGRSASSAGGDMPLLGADFVGVAMRGGELRVVLAERRTRPVVFQRCDFTGADFSDLVVTGAIFEDCVLDDVCLRECVFDRVEVVRGSCVAADFSSADLCDATFTGVDVSRARFTGAMLDEVRFSECRMIGADLTALRGLPVGLSFERCNLQLADLGDTRLRGASLAGSDLTEADLCGTDLREANLAGCRLREVDLSRTRLDGTDLRGADLGEITTESARHLRGAVISPAQAADVCAALGLIVLD